MTYTQLLEHFRSDLRAAARRYVASYTDQGKMISEERAADLVLFEALWSRTDDHVVLHTQTTILCRKLIPTFLAILRRSELCRNVMTVVNDARYNLQAFSVALKQENDALRRELRAASSTVIASGSEALHAQVCELLKENKQLKHDNAALLEENTSLKASLAGVKTQMGKIMRSNKKLASQVQRLTWEVSQIKQGKTATEEGSPSTEILQGLRGLSSSRSFSLSEN